MKYEVGQEVIFLKDVGGRFSKGQVEKIVAVVTAEPEEEPDGTMKNPLFHVKDMHGGSLMWGEGGKQEADCKHYYSASSTNPCKEILMYTPGHYYEAECASTKGYFIRFDKMAEAGPQSSLWVHKSWPDNIHTSKGSFSRLVRELSQDEIDKYFLSQTKKSENGKHNRTEGNVCESPVSEREGERRSTDSIQSGRSKFRLASGSFADTQRAVKSKSKTNRVKVKFST